MDRRCEHSAAYGRDQKLFLTTKNTKGTKSSMDDSIQFVFFVLFVATH